MTKLNLVWNEFHQRWDHAPHVPKAQELVWVPKRAKQPPSPGVVFSNAATKRVSQMPRGLRALRPSGFDKCQHEGHCRMCLRPSHVRRLTRHHLVPLRFWKFIHLEWRCVRNAPNNIIPLCRACHDLVECPDEEIRREARRMCRRAMTQSEIAFAIAVRTKDWFDRHYPV